MVFRGDHLEASVGRLDAVVEKLLSRTPGRMRPAIDRWRADAAALRFHLTRRPERYPMVLAVLGGTGTGKSTLVNRLLRRTVSQTSFRRTFTSGAVAVVAEPERLPPGWLGVERVAAAESDLPARGRTGALLVVSLPGDLTGHLTVVDTPDLDGDQPLHHAEADRVFRWADAILFLVTPEKYQMTEMLPYYRLAGRYRLPARFVMNKCEQQAVADDFASSLARTEAARAAEAGLFVVPRDDAGYEPPPAQNLKALHDSLLALAEPAEADRTEGLRNRGEDLLGRLQDQVLAPLRAQRQEINRLIQLLRGMETPEPGVDVNPLTQQLQRRMQQRSVLYLMGPQRILERVRQAPGLVLRLPRVAWDYIMRGQISPGALSPGQDGESQEVPDFHAILTDQFAVLQSRLDDTLRASPVFRDEAETATAPPYRSAFMDRGSAGNIADEEMAELRNWLEQRWNATPRDTRVLESLVKHLPGGKTITKWTETAPYLLVLVVAAATHHLFGQMDLVVLGGWSLATWLTERLSNEVAAHTRRSNQQIAERFTRLAHEQIQRVCRWLNDQAPSDETLDELEDALERARE